MEEERKNSCSIIATINTYEGIEQYCDIDFTLCTQYRVVFVHVQRLVARSHFKTSVWMKSKLAL